MTLSPKPQSTTESSARNAEPKPVTQRDLDDLVTGSLSPAAYRRTLRALDAEPTRWRDCALAFLEEQAFAQEMKAISASEIALFSNELKGSPSDSLGAGKKASSSPSVSGPLNRPTKCVDGTRFVSVSQSDASVETGAAHVTQDAFMAANSPSSRLEWMHKITMIAAMLLLSFTIGWFGAGLGKSANSGAAGGGKIPGVGFGQDGALATGSTADTGGDGNRMRRSDGFPDVDSMRSPNLRFVGDEVVPVQRTPPEFLQELERRRMIELESYDTYVPLKQGDEYIFVPVEQYRVKQKVFSY